MTYITTTLTIIITLCLCYKPLYTNGYTNTYSPNTYMKGFTRNITLKQGSIQGVIMEFRSHLGLPSVGQYMGIPYARPPIGELRFMPPGSAPSWFRTKFADAFGPVCPQNFPDIKTMSEERKEEFLKLKQFLEYQSEDCLYLNIYAPYEENAMSQRKYPVMIFIHGESFEWNSGNPYDGSVLAAYGKVIVITLNYRLGILGFLKAGIEEYSTKSNFGLVDQIAALVWVKANIASFGGDPDSVTLFGHGTGAVCVSLLTLSPVVIQEGNQMFQRAILMGGSALSDWALAGNPRHVTYQVAQALNCRIDDNFESCLRRKRLDEIIAASPTISPYHTRFGPVIDSVVVPNEPKKSMTTYNNIFRRFQLMYGVTEIESIHLLRPEVLKLGMLEKDRDQELQKYLSFRCEMKPELCLSRTLAEYTQPEFTLDDEKYGGYTGHQPDRASLARDVLLDVLSDARSVAPIVQMGKYHARLNNHSYFYVFTHKTKSKEYISGKSYTGEELPYVFGVPFGGGSKHLSSGHYTNEEQLLSEIIMTYFCNFAYTGDPNMPRKNKFHTPGQNWIYFKENWPKFNLDQQQYLQLDVRPQIRHHYREDKMKFWNEQFPGLTYNFTYYLSPTRKVKPIIVPPQSQPPWITYPAGRYLNKYENFHKPSRGTIIYGNVKTTGTAPPDNMMNGAVEGTVYGTVLNSPDSETKGIGTTITIAFGSLFSLFNICLFLVLCWRRYRKRKIRNGSQKDEEPAVNIDDPNETKLMDGCNIMHIVGKSSRSEDTYEPVKSSRGNNKLRLPRQMSSSTIDAHTKVRDWITNEIVNKYSPRHLRRPRQIHERKNMVPKANSNETIPLNDNNSTLGRSPTRPVSPSDNYKNSHPPLVKSVSNPTPKTKKVEKISVAIDATPSGRGNSVLQQQPIELTKSLDRPNFETPLRRSLTLEDFSIIKPSSKQELRKSTTSINLKFPPTEVPQVIRIEHSHSKSDPVQDLYSYSRVKKLKTFDPNQDVNVTSRDDSIQSVPLTPEESLMTIKRRNFPKVLPDYPSREALAKKRRSMPVANHLFLPIPEIPPQSQPNSPNGKSFGKLPPAPPLRTTSTLSRKLNQPQPVCQSAPMLAQEPPSSPEPELTCNNLYFGPLIPKLSKNELSSSESSKLNTQPIYDSLRMKNKTEKKMGKTVAKTIITTDPNQPIKKIEPKVIIKPTMMRTGSDPKKNIPRVVVHDNLPEDVKAKDSDKNLEKQKKLLKPSQIPTLMKASKESSSSESTPSETSDTGTVVKKM